MSSPTVVYQDKASPSSRRNRSLLPVQFCVAIANSSAFSSFVAMHTYLMHAPILATASAATGRYEHVQLWNCSGTPAQSWQVAPAGVNATIALRNSYNASVNSQLVLDLSDQLKTNTLIQLQYNASGHASQIWTFNSASGQVVSGAPAPGAGAPAFCLTALFVWPGAPAVTQPCLPVPGPTQTWAYDSSLGTLTLVAPAGPGTTGSLTGLCLDARTVITCQDPSLATNLYCNPDAATEDRVADLVSRLLPEDYGLLLTSVAGVGVPRLGVPEQASSFGESLHGVWSAGGAAYTNSTTGYTSSGDMTSFPHLGALGCSFNRTLWGSVADAIGTEAVSLRNQNLIGEAVVASMFFSPDVNLFRYPTWGRGQEVPGEDPFLASEFVAVYAAGLQGGPESKYKRIVSTCKHMAAYDLEDLRPRGYNITRFNFDANVTLGDLVQYYLPPFKACAQRAKAGAVMCSYNAVSGVPNCANGFINNQLLREEWGFTGMIISDCGAFSLICSPSCYT